MNPEKQTDGDYKEKFLTILNNKAKLQSDRSRSGEAQTNGFVVLVRGGKDLKPIQDICFEQNYNRVFTARYRIGQDSIFGTLFAAFFSDLKKLNESEHNTLGNFMPEVSNPAWRYLLDSVQDLISSMQEKNSGTLDSDFFIKLRDSKLNTGTRIVLLGEISKTPKNLSEWELVEDKLFPLIPERFGLVLSGMPEDFHLPVNDPHYLELNLPEEIKSEGTTGNGTDCKLKISSFHSDRPTTKDHLGVYLYAEALARFVLHPQTVPPLTIGIHGPWGKGKSSFMELVDSALVKWAKTNRMRLEELNKLDTEIEQEETELGKQTNQDSFERKKAERKKLWKEMQDAAKNEVVTVRFNAWQYEDSKQIWAGLASRISESLESVLGFWSRVKMPLRYAFKEHRYEFLLNLFLIIFILIFSVYFYLKYPTNISDLLQSSDPNLKILFPAGTALFLISYMVWRTSRVVQPISKHVLNYMQFPNYSEQMGYQHKVMKDLLFVYDYLQNCKPDCKVVVFIDDLDRCSEEKIMEILQAINLILAESNFFVFIGMETGMIYRAIRTHYNKNNGNMPLASDFPENYLLKIIQLSFYIPKTPEEKRIEFLNKLFSVSAQNRLKLNKLKEEREKKIYSGNKDPSANIELNFDLNTIESMIAMEKEVEDTAIELETLCTHLKFLEDNPREIKRMVNIHRLIKIILQLERPKMSWSDEMQKNLVRWLIFCTNWSDLADKVLEKMEEQKTGDGKLKTESLEELINVITKNCPPPQLSDFNLKNFKLDKSELNYELAAQILRKLDESAQPAPEKYGNQTTLSRYKT